MPVSSDKAAVAAASFAKATLPVAATTLITDDVGLVHRTMEVSTPDRPIPAYCARPVSGAKWPVMLVLSEVFGVHAHIADICRRFAKLGYLAVAPELFVRQGDPSSLNTIPEILSNIVAKVPDVQLMQDLDATVEWAETEGGDCSRLGVNGYCWGGRVAWLYAAHSSKVKAAAAWYGRLSGPASDLTPQHPLNMASKLQAPVLGLYAGEDPGIPLGTVEAMREALAHGSPAAQASEILVYPRVGHAFFADYRSSYDPHAATEGWAKAIHWFGAHGV